MSVIYEALKKVESQGKQGQLKDKGRVPNRAPALLSVSGLILVVLVGIWYSPNVFKLLRRHAEVKIKDYQAIPPAAGVASVAPSLPPVSVVPNYTLEGIIFDQENPLAIINGLILKKQGKIDDWEIINITPKEVELMNTKDKAICKLGL